MIIGCEKKTILVVVPSMRGGGAERVILNILRYLNRDLFDIHLALVSKEGHYLPELPNDVIVHDLKADRVLWSARPLYTLIKSINPQIVLSTLSHLNFILIFLKFFFKNRITWIVREGNTVSNLLQEFRFPVIWKIAYRLLYPHADFIISQSKYMALDLAENFAIPEEKLIHIYNPVDTQSIKNRMNLEHTNPYSGFGHGPHIVAIGRLDRQKQFEKLIEAFPLLIKKKKTPHLWILGTGIQKPKLERLCFQFKIEKHVHFVGFQENPYIWLKNADLFVLCSQYEGLPNVLLEAYVCECPVVVVEHPGGSKEIMEISAQMDRWVKTLDWDEKWFQRPAKEVLSVIKENFDVNVIVRKYENLLLRVKNKAS
jgi:glycosyltransferase involved in cell wall biosynthesis